MERDKEDDKVGTGKPVIEIGGGEVIRVTKVRLYF